MDSDRIAYLINRFRSGEATPQEIDELESFWYLAQSDDTQFNALDESERESIRIAMLQNIRSQMSDMTERVHEQSANSPVLSWVWKVAASLTLIVAVAFVWTSVFRSEKIFRSAYGEQMTVRLPDKSLVVINGNSSLKYITGWDERHDREVWIEGEGFFEVTHTLSDQKFIVHTESGMDVQVLGTKFNVKVRRGKTEVMLQEGKVRLNIEQDPANEGLELKPGDLAVFEDAQLETKTVSAKEYSAWKDNKLFFDQTPLADIAILLEDTYGLSVVFEDETLATRSLSGEISADSPLDIIRAITVSLDIEVTHDQERIVFHK